MHWWRVTKYNPKYRDDQGCYIKDEWTCPSQVGTIVEGKIFTWDEYIKVENEYVNAIQIFMDCLGLNILSVSFLVKYWPIEPNEHHTSRMIDIHNKLKDGQILSREDIDNVVRLILRNDLGCKLRSDDLEVHFGWDYYMYIGSKELCESAISKIEKMGLYVEAIEDSPHNTK